MEGALHMNPAQPPACIPTAERFSPVAPLKFITKQQRSSSDSRFGLKKTLKHGNGTKDCGNAHLLGEHFQVLLMGCYCPALRRARAGWSKHCLCELITAYRNAAQSTLAVPTDPCIKTQSDLALHMQ